MKENTKLCSRYSVWMCYRLPLFKRWQDVNLTHPRIFQISFQYSKIPYKRTPYISRPTIKHVSHVSDFICILSMLNLPEYKTMEYWRKPSTLNDSLKRVRLIYTCSLANLRCLNYLKHNVETNLRSPVSLAEWKYFSSLVTFSRHFTSYSSLCAYALRACFRHSSNLDIVCVSCGFLLVTGCDGNFMMLPTKYLQFILFCDNQCQQHADSTPLMRHSTDTEVWAICYIYLQGLRSERSVSSASSARQRHDALDERDHN